VGSAGGRSGHSAQDGGQANTPHHGQGGRNGSPRHSIIASPTKGDATFELLSLISRVYVCGSTTCPDGGALTPHLSTKPEVHRQEATEGAGDDAKDVQAKKKRLSESPPTPDPPRSLRTIHGPMTGTRPRQSSRRPHRPQLGVRVPAQT